MQATNYGLFAALAAAIMMAGVRVFGKKLPKGTASVLTVLGIVLGVLGARLLFCLCNMGTFTETFENPWLMLCFFDGGFSWPGLVGGVIIAAAITARIMKTHTADVLDAAAVPAGLAMAALRFGEQFTDLGVGKAVQEGFATANLPWLFSMSRMGVAVEYRLNVWAYEAVIGLIIFIVTPCLFRTLQNRRGDTALFFAALFGASQIMLESMRDDGHMLLIFLRVGQLGAAALLIASGVILTKRAGRLLKIAMWIDTIACMVGIVLLEFSLDGRLTFGNPTLARDYTLMAVLIANMLLYPLILLFQKKKA